jgi:molybdopterin molybdotransferase
VKGKKISTNSFLLESMIPLYGGVVDRCSILPDNNVLLKSMFDGLHEKQADVVISTGGMGPGKYDLVQDAFCAAGGEIILSSLPMRPGKSILLGKLNDMYFIALPGPPNAVRTLLSEFVGPFVLMLQGASSCWPESFQASLEKSCHVRLQKGVQIKSGILSVVDGCCLVRLSKRLEVASCNIFFAADREDYKKGDLVEVHSLRCL